MEDKIEDVLHGFEEVQDPRIERHKLYPLNEILLVTLCAVISGCETYEDIADFGEVKLDSLRRWLPFAEGVPTKSTIARVMSLLEPEQFKRSFLRWVKRLQSVTDTETIAIDGKTLRHSFDKANNKSAIHMVSAFATNSRLVLGQVKTDTKSNEITAIPELLNSLALENCVITIDAMGCQKDIAEMVVQNKGDYILALKGNHKNFHEDVEHLFSSELDSNSPSVHFEHHKDLDYGHSRLERRKIAVTHDIEWLTNKKEWRGLKSLVMVESDVQGGRNSTERRYFISSLRADAREFGKHIRAHWGIENSLHWVLDVVFREDDSRIRNEKAAENMAIFRHTALNLLQMAKTEYKRMSIKRLRKLAGWSEEHLEKILSQRL